MFLKIMYPKVKCYNEIGGILKVIDWDSILIKYSADSLENITGLYII